MVSELSIPRSESSIYSALTRVFPPSGVPNEQEQRSVQLIRLVSSSVLYPGNFAGAQPLHSAMMTISDNPVVTQSIALGTGKISQEDILYLRQRKGRALGLTEIVAQTPEFLDPQHFDPLLRGMSPGELLDARFNTIRVLASYNIHTNAFHNSITQLGIPDPDQYLRELVTERDVHAAAFVDSALGSWLQRHVKDTGLPREHILMTREGSHAHGITKTLDGEEVVADIAINQALVPSLESIRAIGQLGREYLLRYFKNMSRFNRVVVVHTNQHAANLQAITEHEDDAVEKVPIAERAIVAVRNLVPEQYLDIEPKEYTPDQAAPFIRKAVEQGKVIVGVVERLDPIKRGVTQMNHFTDLVTTLSKTSDGLQILQNLRIAIVAKPKVFEKKGKAAEFMNRYQNTYEALLHEVNRQFREVTGLDDDFIVINRDDTKRVAGMQPSELKDTVFPFFNICMQIGQEGLNNVTQEAAIQTAFGLQVPRPVVGILSQDTGFSEKVTDYKIKNMMILTNPYDPQEVTNALIHAYYQAVFIRNNPQSVLVQETVDSFRSYYENHCADSFYAQPLEALASYRQTRE